MTVLPTDIESLRIFLADHPEHRPTTPRGPGLGLGGRMGKVAFNRWRNVEDFC